MDWLSCVDVGVSLFFCYKKLDTMGAQRQFPPKYIENTFKAIQSTVTFRSVKKYSMQRRCKICICSVTLGKGNLSIFEIRSLQY